MEKGAEDEGRCQLISAFFLARQNTGMTLMASLGSLAQLSDRLRASLPLARSTTAAAGPASAKARILLWGYKLVFIVLIFSKVDLAR